MMLICGIGGSVAVPVKEPAVYFTRVVRERVRICRAAM